MSAEEIKINLDAFKQYLEDSEFIPPKDFFEDFSDLTTEDLQAFSTIWKNGSIQRKLDFFDALNETADSNTLISYESLGMFLLNDPLPAVRKSAIELLWESEDYRLVDALLLIAKDDSDISVQIAAVEALGTFIYLGEIDKFSWDKKEIIEDYLLEVLHSDEIEYKQQKALESLGYSSMDEITDLIQEAIDRHDHEWLLSTVVTIGRTIDEQWIPFILENLDHQDSDIQLEAIRAAGELEIEASTDFLISLIEDADEISDEYFTTIVWSLSQIGGEKSIELIQTLLDNAENEQDIEFLENALDNLEIKQGAGDLDFFSFDPNADHFHEATWSGEDDDDDEYDEEDLED
jgi:HEAT repeat protein